MSFRIFVRIPKTNKDLRVHMSVSLPLCPFLFLCVRFFSFLSVSPPLCSFFFLCARFSSFVSVRFSFVSPSEDV